MARLFKVVFQIERIGTITEQMIDVQLNNVLVAWRAHRSVRVPSIGLVRGRSIKDIKYDEIVIEEKSESSESDEKMVEVETITFTSPIQRSITFQNEVNGTVGILTWEDGIFSFEGNADESAKIFFDTLKGIRND